MPPWTSQDFLIIAAQRMHAADVLFQYGLYLDAAYIVGYAVECSLKALIMERTAVDKRWQQLARITRGATMHRPETLVGILHGELGVKLPERIVERFRRQSFAWSVDLRYETGRGDKNATEALFETARMIYQFVSQELSGGSA